MDNREDVRWHQRLSNFTKALNELKDAVDLANARALSKLEKQGLIQSFEYNFELAWNCIKDFYYSQGESEIQGSRDAFRLAFKRGLITNGECWMDMIKSRVLTSHTYNQATADKIAELIIQAYFPALLQLNIKLSELKNG